MKLGISRFDVFMLLIRFVFGLSLAFSHGLPKLVSFADRANDFADPLGIGPATTMFLVIFSELFCSMLVIVGALTRIAVFPVITVMLIACLMVHSGDPWGMKEPSVIFGIMFALIGLFGAGKISFDYLFFKNY